MSYCKSLKKKEVVKALSTANDLHSHVCSCLLHNYLPGSSVTAWGIDTHATTMSARIDTSLLMPG